MPVPTIYLHLGVHKTATTYLQELFARNRGTIAAHGRAYWRLDEVRPLLANALAEARARSRGRFRLVRQLLPKRRRHFRRFAELASVPMDTILSEENILGFTHQSLEGSFYSRARENLEVVEHALRRRRVEIWLCLRNYPSFLSSLYAEALRHGYATPIEDFLARTRSVDGQWPRLVETIHACFPDARIVVWTYEDFGILKVPIVERLSGMPFNRLVPLPDETVRPSPSSRAVERQSQCVGSLRSPLERKLSMAMLEAEYPLERFPRKFNPWSEADSERMRAAYERDLQAIRSFDYVEFLGVEAGTGATAKEAATG